MELKINFMCVGLPGKVIEIKGKMARIKQNDHFHWVDVSAIGEKVKTGDYLLTYQDAAINKVSEKDAKEVLKLLLKGGSLVDGASDAGVKRAD